MNYFSDFNIECKKCRCQQVDQKVVAYNEFKWLELKCSNCRNIESKRIKDLEW